MPVLLALHADPATAQKWADAVSCADFQVVVAQGVTDCIRRIAQGGVHALVVHDGLSAPTAIEFLAKAREKAPWLWRVLWCDDLARCDLAAAIEQAGVAALWPLAVAPDQIARLLNEMGRVHGAIANSSADAGAEAQVLRVRVEDLERKLKKAERDLQSARNADAALRQEELQLATLKTQEAAQKLGIALEIDYLSDDLEGEISRALDAMLEAPGVRLPVLPQVALDLQELMKDPDVSFEKVSELVKTEASLSARVLSICNSPVYACPDRISNISQAVTRLGVSVMRDLVQTAAMEGLFKSPYKGMEDLMAKLWIHSLATGHANLMVSKELALEDSEDFFAHGLLHDIGKFLITSLIQQGFDLGLWNPRIVTPRLALALIQKRHNELGARLLRKWQYPDDFVEVVAHHNDDANIHRYHESVVVTYYSNALTRKLGYSLVQHDPAILSNHDLAQALNLNDTIGEKIEQAAQAMIDRIKKSYF